MSVLHARMDNQVVWGQARVQIALLEHTVQGKTSWVGSANYVTLGKYPLQDNLPAFVVRNWPGSEVRPPMMQELFVLLVGWERWELPIKHVQHVLQPERLLIQQTLLAFHVKKVSSSHTVQLPVHVSIVLLENIKTKRVKVIVRIVVVAKHPTLARPVNQNVTPVQRANMKQWERVLLVLLEHIKTLLAAVIVRNVNMAKLQLPADHPVNHRVTIVHPVNTGKQMEIRDFV